MTSSTANFGFNLPAPTDPMPDVADGFNLAFTTMRSMVQPNRGTVAGSVLPTLLANPGYNVGDVIYLSGWKSNFILIAKQDVPIPNWGYFWRPLEAAWSPWVRVDNTAFIFNFSPPLGSGLVSAGNNPLQYRISSQGEIQLEGGLVYATSGITGPVPKYVGGSGLSVLANLPDPIKPCFDLDFECALVNPDLTSTAKPYTFAYVTLNRTTGTINVVSFNSSVANDGTATEVHIDMTWPMATRRDQGT